VLILVIKILHEGQKNYHFLVVLMECMALIHTNLACSILEVYHELFIYESSE
jgi:hypothetical protein